MDLNILIDDDFTVEVEEEDEGVETCHIKTEPEVTFDDNQGQNGETDEIHIKQEHDIDIEESYKLIDQFVDIFQIKTEIKSEEDDDVLNEKKTPFLDSGYLESLRLEVIKDEKYKLPETNNLKSESIYLPDSSTEIDQKANLEPPPQATEPLDRRKITKPTPKPSPQKIKVPSPSTPPHAHKQNIIPLKINKFRKAGPSPRFNGNYRNYSKNYRINRAYHNLVPNPFSAKNPPRSRPPNFCNETIWNPQPVQPWNWQTYSVILAALNQIIQQNNVLNQSLGYQHPKQFQCGMLRPQSGPRDQFVNTLLLDSSRLQTYVTILQALRQLTNGTRTYGSCFTSNLRMSLYNMFRF